MGKTLRELVVIPGHEEDARVGPVLAHPRGELAAAHPGHHHVRRQQVDLPPVPLTEPDRLLGAVGLFLTTTHFVQKWFAQIAPFFYSDEESPSRPWAAGLSYAVYGLVLMALGLWLALRTGSGHNTLHAEAQQLLAAGRDVTVLLASFAAMAGVISLARLPSRRSGEQKTHRPKR